MDRKFLDYILDCARKQMLDECSVIPTIFADVNGGGGLVGVIISGIPEGQVERGYTFFSIGGQLALRFESVDCMAFLSEGWIVTGNSTNIGEVVNGSMKVSEHPDRKSALIVVSSDAKKIYSMDCFVAEQSPDGVVFVDVDEYYKHLGQEEGGDKGECEIDSPLLTWFWRGVDAGNKIKAKLDKEKQWRSARSRCGESLI